MKNPMPPKSKVEGGSRLESLDGGEEDKENATSYVDNEKDADIVDDTGDTDSADDLKEVACLLSAAVFCRFQHPNIDTDDDVQGSSDMSLEEDAVEFIASKLFTLSTGTQKHRRYL